MLTYSAVFQNGGLPGLPSNLPFLKRGHPPLCLFQKRDFARIPCIKNSLLDRYLVFFALRHSINFVKHVKVFFFVCEPPLGQFIGQGSLTTNHTLRWEHRLSTTWLGDNEADFLLPCPENCCVSPWDVS